MIKKLKYRTDIYIYIYIYKQNKISPVANHHTMKSYRGRECKALCIVDLDIGWR
jgi:hypothetical protein